MKKWRNTNYYVTENGELLKHWPEKRYTFTKKHPPYSTYNQVIPERWQKLKLHPNMRGYLLYNITENNKKSRTYNIHQLVAECYVSGWFEGAEVDHIDNNFLNNHYSNLQWCTPTYNKLKRHQPLPLYSVWVNI